jgi:hypothetical protein
MLMANITDMAMLFVRCKGGISHNPGEFVSVEDAEIAVDTVLIALEELAQTQIDAPQVAAFRAGRRPTSAMRIVPSCKWPNRYSIPMAG